MSKVALTALFLATLAASASAQPQSLPACPGGPFEGSVKPTRPPEPDDPRNCVATPTGRGTPVRSGGPRRPGDARAPRLLSGAGYHFAGVATVDFTYTGLYGNLEVANVDLSGTGLSHVLNTYLFTPDYFHYIQTGWIDEAYGTDYPRVFVEARVSGVDDRWYLRPVLPDAQHSIFLQRGVEALIVVRDDLVERDLESAGVLCCDAERRRGTAVPRGLLGKRCSSVRARVVVHRLDTDLSGHLGDVGWQYRNVVQVGLAVLRDLVEPLQQLVGRILLTE